MKQIVNNIISYITIINTNTSTCIVNNTYAIF